MDEGIKQAAILLAAAERIAISTGAGISKESNVPTFRDAQEGLWAQYNPQELATPHAFRANPKLVWDWYQWRRSLVNHADPNPGHYALARLQQERTGVTLITQNVDNLHERAGSYGVLHLHGNIAGNRCFANCQGKPTYIDLDTFDTLPEDTPPCCPHCGAFVRPDVVWFGESLPLAELEAAFTAVRSCDALLVIGTSGLVNPAAQLPRYAKQAGAIVIEVNPQQTPISMIADIHLAGAAGVILPKLIEAIHATDS